MILVYFTHYPRYVVEELTTKWDSSSAMRVWKSVTCLLTLFRHAVGWVHLLFFPSDGFSGWVAGMGTLVTMSYRALIDVRSNPCTEQLFQNLPSDWTWTWGIVRQNKGLQKGGRCPCFIETDFRLHF